MTKEEIEKKEFKTSDGKVLSLDEIEHRSIVYMRNIVWGLRTNITLAQYKNWLCTGCNLIELPLDILLEYWMKKWTPTYLAKWSYKNDPKQFSGNQVQ